MRAAFIGSHHRLRRSYTDALETRSDITLAAPNQAADLAIVTASVEDRIAAVEQAGAAAPVVLCPMPLSYGQYDDEKSLVERCQARSILLVPALPLRTLPVFLALKDLLDARTIKQMLAVKLEYQLKAPAARDGESAGDELLAETIVHSIDLLQWLLGDRVIDCYPEIGRTDGGAKSPHTAIMSVSLAGSTYALLDVSLTLPRTYPADQELSIELTGTGGSIRVDAFRQTVDCYAADGALWSSWGSQPITQFLAHLIEALDRPDALPTMREALAASTGAAPAIDAVRTTV